MNSLRNPYIFIRNQWIPWGNHTFSLEVNEFFKESIHFYLKSMNSCCLVPWADQPQEWCTRTRDKLKTFWASIRNLSCLEGANVRNPRQSIQKYKKYKKYEKLSKSIKTMVSGEVHVQNHMILDTHDFGPPLIGKVSFLYFV